MRHSNASMSTSDQPPSPCIRNCCLDDDDICLGCLRSLTEIMAWGGSNAAAKRRILAQAARRKQVRAGNNH